MNYLNHTYGRSSSRGGWITPFEIPGPGRNGTNEAPRLKLTTRAKRLIGGVVLVAAGGVGFSQNSEAQSSTAPIAGDRGGTGEHTPDWALIHIVQPGDTAWDIAREHLPPGAEIRPLVDNIITQAGEDDRPGLHPGDKIYLPPQ